MRRTALALLALVAAALLVACGGDDEGEPLTKEQFIEQADAICTEASAEIQEKVQEAGFSAETRGEEQATFVRDEVVPNIRSQIEGIDALVPPEGDEEQIQEIVDTIDEGLQNLEEDPTLIADPGSKLVEGSALAADYGMTVCGTG